MEHNPSSSSGVDRKTIEKNRRNQMKALYSQLKSHVPSTSREVVSLPDQLDEAAKYIKKLQIKLERMKEKKESLMGVEKPDARLSRGTMVRLRPPQIDVREVESALEVVLVTGLDCMFLFNETIRLLHEEGAEVVNANYYVLDDAAFHTIHSKVGQSATGFEAARISGRLEKFVDGAASFEGSIWSCLYDAIPAHPSRHFYQEGNALKLLTSVMSTLSRFTSAGRIRELSSIC